MRNSKVVTIVFGKSLKNVICNLMHKACLFQVAHYNPVFDKDCNAIGMTATLKGDRFALWLMDKMFNREGIKLDPVKLERRYFEVI